MKCLECDGHGMVIHERTGDSVECPVCEGMGEELANNRMPQYERQRMVQEARTA